MTFKKPLTSLENTIIQRIIDGWTNKQIANQLNYSISGINYHIEKIYKRFKVKNRTQLILKLIKIHKILKDS